MWFRIHDPSRSQVIPIEPIEAKKWNEKHWGIFWTPNEFSKSRKIVDLVKIRAWFTEIDYGSKEGMWKRIQKFLVPSLVVETKRGFQIYWYAKDATKEKFMLIQDALMNKFKGDPNARDLSRLLRVPGFLHWKDVNNPFLVKKVWDGGKYYSEADLIFSLRVKEKKKIVSEIGTKGICLGQLENLSGSAHVKNEIYDLKENGNGTFQIWVNGESTSSWVDENGSIGSHSRGGPTIKQWLYFIWKDYRKVNSILEEKKWNTT